MTKQIDVGKIELDQIDIRFIYGYCRGKQSKGGNDHLLPLIEKLKPFLSDMDKEIIEHKLKELVKLKFR
jgi:hypothetical protein